MAMGSVAKITTAFMAVSISACSTLSPLEHRVIGETMTDGCYKEKTSIQVNKSTGEHVGKPSVSLSDTPLNGCQSFYSQIILVNNPSYNLEDRSLVAASLLLSWANDSLDSRKGFKAAMHLSGATTPNTLLRVVVMDAISMAGSSNPETQQEGLSRIVAIHRQDLFPKFKDEAPRIVEEELARENLTISGVEDDLLKGTREVHSSLVGKQEPKLSCKTINNTFVCNY